MPDLVASDLDRTLIYSARALDLEVPDREAPVLAVSEVFEGAPLSFMTRTAEDLLADLSGAAVFVPVTTRTVAQFERVRLYRASYEFAVTTNGGVLLHRGEPCADWSKAVAGRLTDECAPLEEVERLLPEPTGDGWLLRFKRAEDLFVFAIVDRQKLPAAELDELSMAAGTLGWTVSLQGRKLYLVPRPLTKSAAIAEVARRAGTARTFAAGDSVLDLDLLETADESFRPAHGELHALGVERSNLTVTESHGVRAGEEILRRISARL